MTKDQILCSINQLTCPDDLRIISKATHRRLSALWEQEQQAKYHPFWERAKNWALGTIVYSTGETKYLFDYAKFSIPCGERLIVRKLMPRARAICVERPDRPEWNGKLQRLDARELYSLDCRLDPPSGDAMTTEPVETEGRTSVGR